MPKNANKIKKRTNFDVTTDSLIEKFLTISIKFKIRISLVLAKIELKQQSLNSNALTAKQTSPFHSSYSFLKFVPIKCFLKN